MGLITKRHFIKVAQNKITGEDTHPFIDFISLYATEARYARGVPPPERGAVIASGTVVSSLADKRRHIRGSGRRCRPVSRECQLTNVMAAN